MRAFKICNNWKIYLVSHPTRGDGRGVHSYFWPCAKLSKAYQIKAYAKNQAESRVSREITNGKYTVQF